MSAHTKDLNPDRLLELSNEVSRIASTLARLSTSSDAIMQNLTPDADQPVPEISAETVRAILRARRLRARYFSEELFADPAWDILLDLFHSELTHRRVAVSNLCIAAAVPATTALRWIKSMVDSGIVVRRNDPLDGRRVYVELSHESSVSLRRYFGQIEKTPVV